MWVQSYSGKKIDLLNPKAGMIDIEDIAHALAHVCRFAGNSRLFYSVAEHSVRVGSISGQFALEGLLHDAAEAYLGDIPAPVKQFCKDYRVLEERLMEAVAERFGLAYPIPRIVTVADQQVLLTEKEALMAPEPAPWEIQVATKANVQIACLKPKDAKELFLEYFQRYAAARSR